jgi:hypothetical protein
MARMATLGAASSQTAARAFGTSAMRATTDGQKESIASFMAKFEAIKPSTMDNPHIPSDFMKPAREIPATPPAKLTLNFYMPHEIEFDGVEVDQVQVPATTGDMGVLPGHVPTVVQMRPGVVAVNLNEKDVQKVRLKPPRRAFPGSTRATRGVSGRDRARRNPTFSVQATPGAETGEPRSKTTLTRPPPSPLPLSVFRQQRVRVHPRR